MPSENYRFYCLDAAGRLHDAEWFKADSDEDAVEKIRVRHPDSKCEIWQGSRLVAELAPPHPDDPRFHGRLQNVYSHERL